jgi:hypothetical protein
LNPQKLNLSETVLREEFNRNELRGAHDALYDSGLLLRVVEKYIQQEEKEEDEPTTPYMGGSNCVSFRLDLINTFSLEIYSFKRVFSLYNIQVVYTGEGIFIRQCKGYDSLRGPNIKVNSNLSS